MTFSSGEEKSACLSARDSYWSCLDMVRRVAGRETDIADCPEVRNFFLAACPGHWVCQARVG